MAWVKLDDRMPHHPKLMAAGPEAFALDVAGICYSNAYATDGFIAEATLAAVYPALRNPRKAVERLVEVGRWIKVADGWRIHDIDDFQPTAAEQKEVSRKRSEAGRVGGRRSSRAKQTASNGSAPSEANSKQLAYPEPSNGQATCLQGAQAKDNPDPTRPVVVVTNPVVTPRCRGADSVDLASFRVGKRLGDDPETGVVGYAKSPTAGPGADVLDPLADRLAEICTAENRTTVEREAAAVMDHLLAHVDRLVVDEAIGAYARGKPPVLPRALVSAVRARVAGLGIAVPDWLPPARSA